MLVTTRSSALLDELASPGGRAGLGRSIRLAIASGADPACRWWALETWYRGGSEAEAAPIDRVSDLRTISFQCNGWPAEDASVLVVGKGDGPLLAAWLTAAGICVGVACAFMKRRGQGLLLGLGVGDGDAPHEPWPRACPAASGSGSCSGPARPGPSSSARRTRAGGIRVRTSSGRREAGQRPAGRPDPRRGRTRLDGPPDGLRPGHLVGASTGPGRRHHPRPAPLRRHRQPGSESDAGPAPTRRLRAPPRSGPAGERPRAGPRLLPQAPRTRWNLLPRPRRGSTATSRSSSTATTPSSGDSSRPVPGKSRRRSMASPPSPGSRTGGGRRPSRSRAAAPINCGSRGLSGPPKSAHSSGSTYRPTRAPGLA